MKKNKMRKEHIRTLRTALKNKNRLMDQIQLNYVKL